MAGLVMREAKVDDAPVVALMFSEFNSILGADGLDDEQSFLPENVKVDAEQMARRLSKMTGFERTWISEIDGTPAGMICLRLVPYIGQDAPYAEVTQLYVREAFKRQGIGAALIAEAENAAVKVGATCVHIITGRRNLDAQAFYLAQGYGMPCVEFEKFFDSEPVHA